MSSHGGTTTTPPPLNVTMVAVDKDKNSGYAFRWTIKHIDNPVIIAVHVKHKNIPHRRYPHIFTCLINFISFRLGFIILRYIILFFSMDKY